MVETWEHKTIGDITLAVKDGTHGTYPRYESGPLLLSSKNIADGSIVITDNESHISATDAAAITKNGFPAKNDVLLSCVGTIGKCCVYEQDESIAFQRSVIFMRPDQSQVDPHYLMYVMQSPEMRAQEEAKAQASVQKGLYIGLVEQLELMLPPLPEQERIASILSDLDDLIEKQAKIIDKKKVFKLGILDALLKGTLDEEEYIETTIENCCEILDSYRCPVDGGTRATMQGDIPYCGANGIVDYVNDYTINDNIILIAEDGGYFQEYRTRAIAYRMNGPCWVNNHAHILKAKKGYCQDYIFYVLEHKDINDYVNNGTRVKLNQGELRKIPILFPSLSRQQQIAETMNGIDGELLHLVEEQTKLTQFKVALLRQLITGEIRA